MAVLAAVPLPPTSAADAAPAPGWRLTWATDFSGSALPNQCASYGGPYDGGASYWLADEVTVSGGLLRLGIQRRDHGGKRYTTGGVACYKVAQTYGRYEWRARVPPGKGIDSYAALWPVKNTPNQATLVEILGVPGHEVMAVTNEYGSGSTGEHIAGTYAGAIHTYVIEWTPTRFRLPCRRRTAVHLRPGLEGLEVNQLRRQQRRRLHRPAGRGNQVAGRVPGRPAECVRIRAGHRGTDWGIWIADLSCGDAHAGDHAGCESSHRDRGVDRSAGAFPGGRSFGPRLAVRPRRGAGGRSGFWWSPWSPAGSGWRDFVGDSDWNSEIHSGQPCPPRGVKLDDRSDRWRACAVLTCLTGRRVDGTGTPAETPL